MYIYIHIYMYIYICYKCIYTYVYIWCVAYIGIYMYIQSVASEAHRLMCFASAARDAVSKDTNFGEFEIISLAII